MVQSAERRLRRPISRIPTMGGNRGRGIKAVGAEPGVDARQVQRTAADNRKGIAQGIATAAGVLPLPERGRQKIYIVGGMDGQYRVDAKIAAAANVDQSRSDIGSARSGLVIGLPAAIVQFLRRRMAKLSVVEKADHWYFRAI